MFRAPLRFFPLSVQYLLLQICLLFGVCLIAAPVAAAPTRQDGSADVVALIPPDAAPSPEQVDVDPPPVPVLVAPPSDAVTTGATHPPLGIPVLDWKPVPGATIYHVQLDVTCGFNAPIESDTIATSYSPSDGFTMRPEAVLRNGPWCWRVKAGLGDLVELGAALGGDELAAAADGGHDIAANDAAAVEALVGQNHLAALAVGSQYTGVAGAAAQASQIGRIVARAQAAAHGEADSSHASTAVDSPVSPDTPAAQR